MKTWINAEKGDTVIVALKDQIIYKGNGRPEEANKILLELEANGAQKSLTGIPASYIKSINLEERKNYIEIKFGADSTENITIQNAARKQEIFDYLKNNISGARYSFEKRSPIAAGKKPLIAFCVVAAIFIWTLYIAIGIESGNDYDVTGQRYDSIAGIVLAIASLGVLKVILIFGPLLLIAILAFIRKAKNPPAIHSLKLK